MNRKSLFARLAEKCAARPTAPRQEYFRVQLEPLEQRKLLTATHLVSDYWIDSSDPDGSIGYNAGDTLLEPVTNYTGYAGDGVSFGKIAYYDTNTGNWLGTFHNIVDGSNNDLSTIHSAIEASGAGDIVQLEPKWTNAYSATAVPQTFEESDIVVDKAGLNLEGDSGFGSSYAVIAPEVASSRGEEAFPVGSHSGIIITAPTVTVTNLTVDGNAGVGGASSFNFHQGITTLYDNSGGGNYSSQHNGSMAPNSLGLATGGDTKSLTITGVTVQNTWYKGITISDVSGQTYQNAFVLNNTVQNVGTDFGSLTQAQINERTGILMMNVDYGSIRGNVITNTGVGAATNLFGTPWTIGGGQNDNNARNHIGVSFNTVTDANSIGYSMIYEDDPIDSNLLLDITSTFGYGMVGNTATWTSTSNTATGIYMNYSQPYIMGGVITNAHIGFHVQNMSLVDTPHGVPQQPELTGTTLIGPGSGISGSIGVLIDNDSSFSHSSSAIIGGGTRISSYETGIEAVQNVTPSDATTNYVQIGTVYLTGNGTGVVVGNGSVADGSTYGSSTGAAATDSYTTSGNGQFNAGYPTNGFTANATVNNNNALGTITPPNSDVLNTGNLSLSSSSTFTPLLTGLTGSHDLFNFDAPLNDPLGRGNTFPPGSVPAPPASGITQTPYGGTGIIGGTQDGTGGQAGGGALVTTGVNANNGTPGFLFGSNTSYVGGGYWSLIPTDISDSNIVKVVAKLDSLDASTCPYFTIGLDDIDQDFMMWTIPTSLLSTASWSTISLNILSQGLPVTGLGVCDGNYFDLSHVCTWIMAGDYGMSTGGQNLDIAMRIDDISTASTKNSQVAATGSVSLNGATLGATLASGYVPTTGAQFTIINKTSAGAVSGTFAGLAQGATTSISGHSFSISYTGGDGNDVVLTKVPDVSDVDAPVFDLNGAAAGTSYTTSWSNAGAVYVTDAAATVTDADTTNLASLTVALASPQAGDTLTADNSAHPGDRLVLRRQHVDPQRQRTAGRLHRHPADDPVQQHVAAFGRQHRGAQLLGQRRHADQHHRDHDDRRGTGSRPQRGGGRHQLHVVVGWDCGDCRWRSPTRPMPRSPTPAPRTSRC